MAHNAKASLTSIEIVQQQRYAIDFASGSKRTFEQFSSFEPQPRFNQPAKLTTCTNNAPELLSNRRRFIPAEHGRLAASKISSLALESTEANNETTHTQKIHATSQPNSSLNPLLTLSHPRYGLPESLVRNFTSLGIEHIYPWQSSCLLGRGLLTGEKSLVYTAPTGGGKSLVADVLMLKGILASPHAKAILVLPYVALVQEKVNWLRRAVEGVEEDIQLSSQQAESKHSNSTLRRPHDRPIRVVGFFGGSKTRATWADVDIAVCTFEKASGRNYDSRYWPC